MNYGEETSAITLVEMHQNEHSQDVEHHTNKCIKSLQSKGQNDTGMLQ